MSNIPELRRLLEAATPAPWTASECGPSIWCGELSENTPGHACGKTKESFPIIDLDGANYEDNFDEDELDEGCDGYEFALDDARLIAAARNALPGLLDDIAEAVRLLNIVVSGGDLVGTPNYQAAVQLVQRLGSR